MRASTLSLLIAAALAGHATPLLAQTPAPDKSSQAAPVAPDKSDAPSDPKAKSDDALSPSTLPKARQSAKEAGTNHIDELSPDEARRLERLRAKAAASKPQPAKPQPAAPANPAPEQAAKAPSPPPMPETAAPSKEAAQTPAADTKATVGAADKATRRATRRARRPARDTADLDGRRSSRRASRRDEPEVADRTPRVGDVVPPDVPLFPMGAGPRAHPPFPGREDDDDGPPRRRIFMAPW